MHDTTSNINRTIGVNLILAMFATALSCARLQKRGNQGGVVAELLVGLIFLSATLHKCTKLS
ncbi:MAG: hypothetical protein CTY31_06855 [Hyphomicrobium sp.]|nr:MAG: hypothetical protein CTY31_06855 [Hyphomicrobium sp.]